MVKRNLPTMGALFLSLVYLAGCRQPVPVRAEAKKEPAVPILPQKPTQPSFQEIAFGSLSSRTPVIMYHDVIRERNADAQWYDVTEREFEDQMKWILDQGIQPISLQELYEHLTEGTPVPEKAIVLTFDDNYLGFKEIAWPILKRYGFPSAMFVHTGFVGKTKPGRPKMTWNDLRDLAKDPMFTVGAHTVTHPEDMRKLSAEKQLREMSESKKAIEKHLGQSVPFLAYPNGMNDKTTQQGAKKAGFLMAFSIDNSLAEESPGILCVNRYIHTRLTKAWQDRNASVDGTPAGVHLQAMVDAPVTLQKSTIERVKLILVKGGRPESLNSSTRLGVLDFVQRAGAVAGINGGFFVMSDIRGTDNNMLGPFKASDMPILLPDKEPSRWPKLRNRPVVMWGPSQFAIVPFQPEVMKTEESFRRFMPDLTDVFLAGAWLVHQGLPRTRTQMNTFTSKDIQDMRRRAFLGTMADGSVVLGASRNSVSSEMIAKAAAAAGVWEAVLLDSGFSTSLIYDGKVLASGHSTDKIPSRPVPHAIVLKGNLQKADASEAVAKTAAGKKGS